MNSGRFFHRYLFIFFLLATVGCGAPRSAKNGGTSIAIANGPPEEAYCSTPVAYGGSTASVTGTATYQARELTGSGLGNPGTPKPIRYAEVKVKDSSGNTAQCATTDVNGDFSFTLPDNSATYTVYINSRADNSYLKASVLDRPDRNIHYSISKSFVSTGTPALGSINAEANNSVVGGAFNILDQLVEANDYLRSQTSGATPNCATDFAGCIDFTVAPKVSAYWMKGVNPGDYINSGPLSFYLPGYRRLFILGGLNGDTDNTDTDHFDNSIVIHEYGHFLEDVIFQSNSPGGAHNGNKVIDPRLAWSEGFANFFQAAVLDDPYYRDTRGNVDGDTAYLILFNIETANPSTQDEPEYDGEGIFREFSITRLLWDAIDTNSDTVNTHNDNVSGAFKDIWAALTKTSGGMSQSNLSFRNMGHFHLFQNALPGRTDFANLRSMERQIANTSEYAQYVTPGTCADYSLTPVSVPGDTGSYSTSHLLLNNDFYHLKISSTQSVTLTLEYEDADDTAVEADVDLYLYNSNGRFGVAADMVGYSYSESDGDPTDIEYESITVTLQPGDYLINVNVFTGINIGSAFNYRIKLNGSTLCPSSLP